MIPSSWRVRSPAIVAGLLPSARSVSTSPAGCTTRRSSPSSIPDPMGRGATTPPTRNRGTTIPLDRSAGPKAATSSRSSTSWRRASSRFNPSSPPLPDPESGSGLRVDLRQVPRALPWCPPYLCCSAAGPNNQGGVLNTPMRWHPMSALVSLARATSHLQRCCRPSRGREVSIWSASPRPADCTRGMPPPNSALPLLHPISMMCSRTNASTRLPF